MSFAFSRPRKAVAAAYGIAGTQESNRVSAALGDVQLAVGLCHRHDLADRRRELALVDPAGPAVEVGMGELAVLEQAEQPRLADLEVHRHEPRSQQRQRILRAEVATDRPVTDVALAHHPFDDLQDGGGIGSRRALAVPERPDRECHRGVGPLGGASLRSVGLGSAGAYVGEKLLGRVRSRGLRERTADIDSGVVVRAPDRGSPMGLDVDERRQVELLGARAVPCLPDREQLRQAPPVARGQRRLDGIEGVCQCRGDLARVQVLGAGFDVATVGLQPVVIVRRVPVTEHVHGLRFAAEPNGQLLREKGVRQVADQQGAGDRVVVGDRYVIHPSALGELVDLFRGCGALRQVQGALDAKLRQLRGGRVDVHVGTACLVHDLED